MSAVAGLVALGKTAKGKAAENLIRQAVDDRSVLVFSELLALPGIQELGKSEDAEARRHWDLLQLFAFGTYSDWLGAQDRLGGLSASATEKLRQLSLVSLAKGRQRLSYAELQKALGMENLRELEDLIIDAVYKEILTAKLDQAEQSLEVEGAMGRDVRPEEVKGILATLEGWEKEVSAVEHRLKTEIAAVEERRQAAAKEKSRVDEEFKNLKKTIKVVNSGGPPEALDDAEVSSSKDHSAAPERKKEKAQRKLTGLRGSSNNRNKP